MPACAFARVRRADFFTIKILSDQPFMAGLCVQSFHLKNCSNLRSHFLWRETFDNVFMSGIVACTRAIWMATTYQITCVNEVRQWQVQACVQGIIEA